MKYIYYIILKISKFMFKMIIYFSILDKTLEIGVILKILYTKK